MLLLERKLMCQFLVDSSSSSSSSQCWTQQRVVELHNIENERLVAWITGQEIRKEEKKRNSLLANDNTAA